MRGKIKIKPVDIWILNPLRRFMSNSTTSGMILFGSALLALILSNSPWSDDFHHLWEIHFSVGFNGNFIDKSLHHWINDGLMAVFFFVIGLELKREIVGGELSSPKNAVLPLVAAVGGMLIPALIYLIFNPVGDESNGWGIPMATDIAFALGVLYLLGDKVPVSLKIFLTALAIADDLGAVLVIAFFYTSEIDFASLITGGIFMIILVFSNIIGVRNTLYYAIIGIGGLWLAFLMSGVHATIAAVLAAFTIPANVKASRGYYINKIGELLEKFKRSKTNKLSIVTNEELHVIDEVVNLSKKASTPLQRLEHSMHPLVAFVIMPVFALSNAGVTFSGNVLDSFLSPVSMGIFFGLILGKVIGIVGLVFFLTKLKWAKLPEGMNFSHVWGVSFLAAIGFTMSLFIAGLAFKDVDLVYQSKLGILSASIISGFVGYLIIKKANKKIVKAKNI